MSMVRPSNVPAIERATRRAWDEWVAMLDGSGARELGHTAIARRARELMAPGVQRADWWAQGTAIAYEQQVGLRVPGQSCDGDYQLSISRTIPGDMDTVLRAWCVLTTEYDDFAGVAVEGVPETSHTEKWRYWRARLADGTRVSCNISVKAPGKIGVAIVHAKLDAAEAIEHWRPVWRSMLAQL